MQWFSIFKLFFIPMCSCFKDFGSFGWRLAGWLAGCLTGELAGVVAGVCCQKTTCLPEHVFCQKLTKLLISSASENPPSFFYFSKSASTILNWPFAGGLAGELAGGLVVSFGGLLLGWLVGSLVGCWWVGWWVAWWVAW